ncbi:hypothetical protein MRX96_020161 [Rhipicephalus microplus]
MACWKWTREPMRSGCGDAGVLYRHFIFVKSLPISVHDRVRLRGPTGRKRRRDENVSPSQNGHVAPGDVKDSPEDGWLVRRTRDSKMGVARKLNTQGSRVLTKRADGIDGGHHKVAARNNGRWSLAPTATPPGSNTGA